MTESCPNCGKPVLETDTVCWHCGYQLPRRPKPHKPTAGAAGRPRAVTDSPDVDFRALAIYGLLTLAVILGLWLVMRSLSRYPILVRSAGLDLGGNWVAVTDVNLRYTLSLPTEWQWLDVAFRDQEDVLDQVTGRQPYIERALRPLGEAAGDVAIVGVAVGTQTLEDTEPQPFLVIGQSGRLRELAPQAALDLLADEALPVSEKEINTRLAGQAQARFNVLDMPNAYQCRHLFVTDNEAGYLVAACSPQASFATLRRDLDDILDSFQLLEH